MANGNGYWLLEWMDKDVNESKGWLFGLKYIISLTFFC